MTERERVSRGVGACGGKAAIPLGLGVAATLSCGATGLRWHSTVGYRPEQEWAWNGNHDGEYSSFLYYEVGLSGPVGKTDERRAKDQLREQKLTNDLLQQQLTVETVAAKPTTPPQAADGDFPLAETLTGGTALIGAVVFAILRHRWGRGGGGGDDE